MLFRMIRKIKVSSDWFGCVLVISFFVSCKRLTTAWTTSLSFYCPSRNLSTIKCSWKDPPGKKLASIFIQVIENAAFLFCLSGKIEQSFTSVANLRQNRKSWKFGFFSKFSMCLVKRSLSQNDFTLGQRKTCERISTSTRATSGSVENI